MRFIRYIVITSTLLSELLLCPKLVADTNKNITSTDLTENKTKNAIVLRKSFGDEYLRNLILRMKKNNLISQTIKEAKPKSEVPLSVSQINTDQGKATVSFKKKAVIGKSDVVGGNLTYVGNTLQKMMLSYSSGNTYVDASFNPINQGNEVKVRKAIVQGIEVTAMLTDTSEISYTAQVKMIKNMLITGYFNPSDKRGTGVVSTKMINGLFDASLSFDVNPSLLRTKTSLTATIGQYLWIADKLNIAYDGRNNLLSGARTDSLSFSLAKKAGSIDFIVGINSIGLTNTSLQPNFYFRIGYSGKL